MGRDAPVCLADVRRLGKVGERVVAAPDASADAFAADLWDTGVERAGDLAEAVERLEQAREAIGDGLTEAAWSMDLSATRAVLSSHGTGFFKIFSGEWRQANRLVRTVISYPEQPLDDTLAQLDALAKGQKAQKTIEEEDAFARSAFGADWRGDRSNSAGLIGLVEWMRSLKGSARNRVSSQPTGRIAMRSICGSVDARHLFPRYCLCSMALDRAAIDSAGVWRSSGSRARRD
jgi:hypothetical protein